MEIEQIIINLLKLNPIIKYEPKSPHYGKLHIFYKGMTITMNPSTGFSDNCTVDIDGSVSIQINEEYYFMVHKQYKKQDKIKFLKENIEKDLRTRKINNINGTE